MVTIPFQKPDKVIMLESSDSFGVFEFRPLEPGYGVTIGNALRRVLLSSLEGFAITSMKIEGVLHEFSTIPGVLEDVTDMVLNMKQIRLKSKIEEWRQSESKSQDSTTVASKSGTGLVSISSGGRKTSAPMARSPTIAIRTKTQGCRPICF